MSVSKLPTVVAVPGAFHVPKHFQPVTDILQSHGYKVVGVTHPEPGKWKTEIASFDELVGNIRAYVEAEISLGNDVLLVVHSASGVTGPAAIHGLAKQHGSNQAGVVGIFAIAAIMGGVGKNTIDICAGKTCSWLRPEGDTFVPLAYDTPGDPPTTIGPFVVAPPVALYNDLPEDVKRASYDALVPIFQSSFIGSPNVAGWKEVPLTYVVCEKDLALMAEVQEEIIKSLDTKIDVKRIDASHSPFLSKPLEIATWIREAAGENVE